MKKITSFLIDKRNYILVLMILITIGCLFLETKVKINKDISKYLPSDTETRIGMDKMDEEFSNSTMSYLNLMFKGLKEEEKNNIYNELDNLPNVSEVDYDSSEKYNKDDYTLYVLTVKDHADSDKAKNLYNTIMTNYKNYEIYTSGDISSENKEVLPLWIVFLAIFCALIILIIMCDSYLEPILFLFAIGLSVFINKGTNIIFPSISSITSAIAAILQLALSMDYSIMLMNRYRDEKTREKDKVKAMKNALNSSILSICSSSVTTIVGLLALVFMSFTIGRDLGLVLAKGVLFSLLTIFTCLPALILMFDKYITKTKKKRPTFKLDGLGKFAYHFRYFGIALFIVIFIVSFLLKGNLGILYTDSETDDVKKVFNTNNQLAIIYNNKYENLISDYCKKLEDNQMIDDVLCYSNTINEKLTADKLNIKLDDLGSSVNVEEYLTKIIYYHYFNNKEDNKVNLNSLLNFIKNDVYKNKEMNAKINNETKENIDKLLVFTASDLMNSKKDSKSLASMFELKESQVKELFILYNSLNNTTKIDINKFTEFLNKDVINSKYGSSIDKNSLNILNNFTNQSIINKPMNNVSLANLFGIDKDVVSKLLLLKYSNVTLDYKITIKDFIDTCLYLKDNTNYLDDINRNLLVSFSESSFAKDPTLYSKEQIAAFLGMDDSKINLIFVYNLYLNDNISDWTFTPYEFVNFILDNKDNPLLKNSLDINILNNLTKLQKIMDLSLNNNSLNSKDMASILNINVKDMQLLYSLYDIDVLQKSVKVSYRDFVSFLLNDVLNDPNYKKELSQDKITKLKTLDKIMNDTNKKVKYNKDELYNLVTKLTNNVDKDLIDLVYIYYGSVNDYNKEYALTIEEFVNYLNNTILLDDRFNDFLTTQRRNDILDSKDVVNDARELLLGSTYSRAVLNTSYSSEGEETFNFIKSLKDNLNKDDIYVVGNSMVAYEISKTFQNELNFITILTIIFIFIVVAITFKKALIPIILVLLIQTAVYLTMGILTFEGGTVYFISLLIVQSILMGATIDYAILYTSYYLESRREMNIKESIINAYNKSIHTILTSASILTLVTLVVGHFGSQIASKICITISQGTICSTILILLILPEIIASLDKFIVKKRITKQK